MLESAKRVTCGRQSEMKGNHTDFLMEALNISNKEEDDLNTDFDHVFKEYYKSVSYCVYPNLPIIYIVVYTSPCLDVAKSFVPTQILMQE